MNDGVAETVTLRERMQELKRLYARWSSDYEEFNQRRAELAWTDKDLKVHLAFSVELDGLKEAARRLFAEIERLGSSARHSTSA